MVSFSAAGHRRTEWGMCRPPSRAPLSAPKRRAPVDVVGRPTSRHTCEAEEEGAGEEGEEGERGACGGGEGAGGQTERRGDAGDGGDWVKELSGGSLSLPGLVGEIGEGRGWL